MKPIVPCGLGAAPVERHRWHDVRGQRVLDEEVADLRAVAVRDDDLVTGRDELGDGLHGHGDGLALRLRAGATVGADHRVATQRDDEPHEVARGPRELVMRRA